MIFDCFDGEFNHWVIIISLEGVFFFSSISFCAVTEVESDERVSKLVTRIYGEVPQSSSKNFELEWIF